MRELAMDPMKAPTGMQPLSIPCATPKSMVELNILRIVAIGMDPK